VNTKQQKEKEFLGHLCGIFRDKFDSKFIEERTLLGWSQVHLWLEEGKKRQTIWIFLPRLLEEGKKRQTIWVFLPRLFAMQPKCTECIHANVCM